MIARGVSAARLLWLLVGLGLAVRLWGVSFGLPHVRARPDELFVLDTVVKMHAGNPNPGFFDYPGLYMYLVAGLYSIYYGIGLVAGWFTSPADFTANFKLHWETYFLIPRITSAFLGTATIGVVYAVTRAAAGTRAALLAAAFIALAFLHVRDSHYATTDVPMTFFAMCAVLATMRVYRERSARDAWLAGALAGCAASVKYNAVLIVLPMAVSEGLRAWDSRADWRRAVRETQIWRMAAGCILVFALTNPYLFLDYGRALHDLQALQASTASGMTPPEMLGRGWTYHLPNSLRHGLGEPLLASGLAGMVLMARHAPREALLLATFPLAYYAVVGAGYNVFVRYMIPVVPFVCLFAGYAASAAAGALGRLAGSRREALIAALLGAAIVAPSAYRVVQFDRLLAREDNRIVAARWVHQHIPAGSLVFMSANLYGHPQLEQGPERKYRYLEFDRRNQVFLADQHPTDLLPEWIIVQHSAIPYSKTAPRVAALLETDYRLVHAITAADLEQQNFYDIQDGFYAPFGSFRGVRRFGPNFEIYEKKR